jgi:hypothetical protein
VTTLSCALKESTTAFLNRMVQLTDKLLNSYHCEMAYHLTLYLFEYLLSSYSKRFAFVVFYFF